MELTCGRSKEKNGYCNIMCCKACISYCKPCMSCCKVCMSYCNLCITCGKPCSGSTSGLFYKLCQKGENPYIYPIKICLTTCNLKLLMCIMFLIFGNELLTSVRRSIIGMTVRRSHQASSG